MSHSIWKQGVAGSTARPWLWLAAWSLQLVALPSAWAQADAAREQLASPARTVGDVYKPGEERVWIFESDGQRIGEHLFRYEGPVDPLGASHRFHGQVRLAAVPAMPVEQRYTVELITDALGHLLHQVLRAQLGDSLSSVEVTVADGKGAARITQGSGERNLEIDVPADTFLQANNVLGTFDLLLSLHPPEPGASRTYSLLSANVLRTFPYKVAPADADGGQDAGGRADAEAGADAAATDSPAATSNRSRKLKDSLGEVLTLDADGRLARLEMAAQKLVVRHVDEAVERFSIADPQTLTLPDRFDAEEVSIAHGDVLLAGTLTRPKGAQERLPGVFFISGSGLQDRHGNAGALGIGTYEVLDRLTDAGFAVLRVDDRGAGQSTGPTQGMSYTDLVDDARACVDFLLSREDVDPARIALIGHSEGAVTAPILALERPGLAAIVLMAGTGRPLDQVIREQVAAGLDRQDMDAATRERTLSQLEDGLRKVAAGEELDTSDWPPGLAMLFSSPDWLRQHAHIDPAANLARVGCPVLILQGARDIQVSAERDATALARALEQTRHPDHALRVFDNLDHLFKAVDDDGSELGQYFKRRPVDEEFLDVLVSWLSERLIES